MRPWISSSGNGENSEMEDDYNSESNGALDVDVNAVRLAAVEEEDSDKIHKGSSN